MKSDSKLFDSIRISRRRTPEEVQETRPGCDWPGCDKPGLHKAPKGARAEGEFHTFCLDHVRAYNKTYNYFEGMNDADISAHMEKMNAPGAKPTQAWGTNRFGRSNPQPRAAPPPNTGASRRYHDPHNFFARVERNRARVSGNTAADERALRLTAQDRIAFEALGLDGRTSKAEIKTAYKALVKLHHPDANGGDRSSEDRLRAIISAYNHLKSKGFV